METPRESVASNARGDAASNARGDVASVARGDAASITRGDVAPGPSVDELLREIDFVGGQLGATPQRPRALADYGLAELATDEFDFDDEDEFEFKDGQPEKSSYADFASQYKRGFQDADADNIGSGSGDLYGGAENYSAGVAEIAEIAEVADTCDSIHALTKAQAVTLRTVAAQVATLSAEVAELAALLRQMVSAMNALQKA